MDDDSPFHADARTLAALVISIVVGAVANASGVGGGAIYIPLFNALVGFDLKPSTALSQAAITAGALAQVTLNLLKAHPVHRDMPLVDFTLVLALTPVLLVGVGIGVMLNVVLPALMLTILLLLLLVALTVQTGHKGRALWRQESIKKFDAAAAAAIDGRGDFSSAPRRRNAVRPAAAAAGATPLLTMCRQRLLGLDAGGYSSLECMEGAGLSSPSAGEAELESPDARVTVVTAGRRAAAVGASPAAEGPNVPKGTHALPRPARHPAHHNQPAGEVAPLFVSWGCMEGMRPADASAAAVAVEEAVLLQGPEEADNEELSNASSRAHAAIDIAQLRGGAPLSPAPSLPMSLADSFWAFNELGVSHLGGDDDDQQDGWPALRPSRPSGLDSGDLGSAPLSARALLDYGMARRGMRLLRAPTMPGRGPNADPSSVQAEGSADGESSWMQRRSKWRKVMARAPPVRPRPAVQPTGAGASQPADISAATPLLAHDSLAYAHSLPPSNTASQPPHGLHQHQAHSLPIAPTALPMALPTVEEEGQAYNSPQGSGQPVVRAPRASGGGGSSSDEAGRHLTHDYQPPPLVVAVQPIERQDSTDLPSARSLLAASLQRHKEESLLSAETPSPRDETGEDGGAGGTASDQLLTAPGVHSSQTSHGAEDGATRRLSYQQGPDPEPATTTVVDGRATGSERSIVVAASTATAADGPAGAAAASDPAGHSARAGTDPRVAVRNLTWAARVQEAVRRLPGRSVAMLLVVWGVYLGLQVLRSQQPRCSPGWWGIFTAQVVAMLAASCVMVAAFKRSAAAAARAAAQRFAGSGGQGSTGQGGQAVADVSRGKGVRYVYTRASTAADASLRPEVAAVAATAPQASAPWSPVPVTATGQAPEGATPAAAGGTAVPVPAAASAPGAASNAAEQGRSVQAAAPPPAKAAQPAAAAEYGLAQAAGSGVLLLAAPIRTLAITFAAGAAGGLLGLGGGMVMGPLLLHLGVQPQVAAATSGAMVLFSSSTALIQFALLGRLNLPYAGVFGAASVLASITGVVVVAGAVRRSGRPSIVVFALVCVMATGAVCVAAFGLSSSIKQEMRGEGGFTHLCVR